jgi:hypothetical protein
VAAHQKKARDLRATLAFTDESGFLLAPLARRSLARTAHTPVLRQRARQRDKISAAAALVLSPWRGRIGLHCLLYPNLHLDGDLYAGFLRWLLGRVPGPVVLVHDGGSLHQGPSVAEVSARFPRLSLHPLPPYAPELNPVEYLWTHSKAYRLANFAPEDLGALQEVLCDVLHDVRADQGRLRSFYRSSPLPWTGTTLTI